MRHINVENWPRGEHYKLFRTFDHPHFNMCANVDLTAFYPALKKHRIPFTLGVLYVISRAANDIPEFRYRIRGDDVVEHETVHPSLTILADQDLFGFCTIDYFEDFSIFASRAAEKIAAAKRRPTLEDHAGRDELLFMTAIPWVAFTSFAHPTHLHPADSIPRFAWGKRFEDGKLLKMPLSVQGHHALLDGIHMGRYYERAQAYFSQPALILGNG